MRQYVLALDQGTTSSRAIVFDRAGRLVAMEQQEFRQILPAPGLVEHDPEDIWESQLVTARAALAKGQWTARDIAAIGIANQRETTLLWERRTGHPVAHAVVWQSRVSGPICQRLKQAGWEPLFRERTGLLLDPYFSGTKVRHLLEQQPGLQARAEKGEILFGTVDSFLIWRLTGGRVHATDISNASRTLLFNIHTRAWDEELLTVLQIPRAMLPEVVSSSQVIGETDAQWFGSAIPVAGCAGDQQAASFGQTCFAPGTAKNTYGTGCFLLFNTGDRPQASQHQLLTTIGWQIGGEVTYFLEGAVFVAGAVVQWLRDGLGLIRQAAEIESLAASVSDNGGVVMVPAFAGLGAPYWDPDARGTILGITRGTTKGHIARAAIESIAWQTRDLVESLQADAGQRLTELKVDGGAAMNDGLLQFQADCLGIPVLRPRIHETTAPGAAYLAGLAVGVWPNLTDLAGHWQLDREFQPRMTESDRQAGYERWQAAVVRLQGLVRNLDNQAIIAVCVPVRILFIFDFHGAPMMPQEASAWSWFIATDRSDDHVPSEDWLATVGWRPSAEQRDWVSPRGWQFDHQLLTLSATEGLSANKSPQLPPSGPPCAAGIAGESLGEGEWESVKYLRTNAEVPARPWECDWMGTISPASLHAEDEDDDGDDDDDDADDDDDDSLDDDDIPLDWPDEQDDFEEFDEDDFDDDFDDDFEEEVEDQEFKESEEGFGFSSKDSPEEE